ncbi:hypothetical protein SAMN05216548_10625 [Faunimonas pinastri]|uniref:Uncharacterized protein n=1 Tax=Faunimonas pinastri TaxID=1855383 RepID=A0A1H9HFH4_9HYPH|nr:hypothetical protein [Faunimonas pinastri]SEQ61089.1 hypothetical protein SAMN05216548_10625 [Faunimonas pinastri]
MKTHARTLQNEIAGAWAVMNGRPEGLGRMDLSASGFWQSFLALVPILPFVILQFLGQWKLGTTLDPTPQPLGVGDIAEQLIETTIEWFVFPVVFASMARPFRLTAGFVPFIVARNWSTVITGAIFALPYALYGAGLIGPTFLPFLVLIAFGTTLRFSYLLTRVTLGVGPGVAIPIVILDVLVGVVSELLIDKIL